MNIPQQVQALLHALGQRMGLREFQLDAEGSGALALDQRIIINLQYREAEDELWLYTDLGLVPQRSPAFYQKLLQANFFWQQTAGATLSLSTAQPPRAVLAHPLHCKLLDDASLAAAVQAFVLTVENWQKQLQQTEGETDASAEAARSPMADNLQLLLRSKA